MEETIKSDKVIPENLANETLRIQMDINEKANSSKGHPQISTVATSLSSSNNEVERGNWTNQLDFLFSCISLSVGLGNVWRFPYLCYKNGGGAFIVTYTIAMLVCGIPMFFQEVAIGQYLGSGGMTFVGQLCPILKGVGYATMTIVFLLDIYYCIIISWTIFYIVTTLVHTSAKMPWADCGNWWNTENCYSVITDNRSSTIMHQEQTLVNGNRTKIPSVEEFFERRVLGLSSSLEAMGSVKWELFVCLFGGWLIIFLIIRKGLHQSGKIIWFTALFPYVVLAILTIRAVTLQGAAAGLYYFITPQWDALLTVAPWMEGASQIFFAYSIGCGALPALGSYNKFHHNCYKDALITCIVNTLTSLMAGIVTFSILGYIASEQGSQVADVVKSGPGLVFLTYPEVVLKLPGTAFWALTFFVMLLILGIDSEFCLVESFITGVVDNWPNALNAHRGKFTAGVCIAMFALGIPMVTNGGMYIFQLMDYYSASGMSLLWVCFFQTVGISWVFGVDRLSDCIEEMVGIRPNRFWTVCWKYLAPLTIILIFLGHCIQYTSLKYGQYEYPGWAEILGLGLSLVSMMWIPIYAIYYALFAGHGSILENIKAGFQRQIEGETPATPEKKPTLPFTDSNIGLISKNPSFISS